MVSKLKTNFRVRRDYSDMKEVIDVPHLISLQRKSYELFLQQAVDPEKRTSVGLQRVFNTVFPVSDYNGAASLEFVSYKIGDPKYDTEECRARGMTWSAPLRVTIQLVLWDTDPDTGVKSLSALKEDEVYFGEVPLMTEKGTFIINGTERVVVTQLHRSPGVFFSHDNGKTHVSGKLLYNARIIPYRGSWLDLEFDPKDIMHVRIDRRRKLNASVLLRALGMSVDDMLSEYYHSDIISFEKGQAFKKFIPTQLEGQRAFKEIKIDGKTYIKAGAKFNRAILRRLSSTDLKKIEIDPETVSGMISAKTIIEATEDIFNPANDELLMRGGDILVGWEDIMEKFGLLFTELDYDEAEEICEALNVLVYAGDELIADKVNAKGEVVEPGNIAEIRARGLENIEVLYIDDRHIGDALWKTIQTDKLSPDADDLYSRLIGKPSIDALIEIYRRLRPGDPPRPETASAMFNTMLFSSERYDLSEIGRYKLNYKLYVSQSKEAPLVEDGTLAQQDIVETIRYLLSLRTGYNPYQYQVDDIDHLGNRRIRAVGELVENQILVGLVRLERAARERMSMQDVDTLVPQDLVNYKLLAAVLKEFFGSSQLSQFMDQVNPLSEITHKRRLSALGPGGLTRDRAGFEVRDVNSSHYGRICPIETPEGPNIGLISSMSVYSRVNDFGFLETPYRVVDEDKKVTDEIVYLSALEEERETIAQATYADNPEQDQVICRKGGDYVQVPAEDITKVDVSPRQIVSVAASLIPFLENDDANRALMGSNMQRQAVPCVKAQAPLVGTGMEAVVARDSGATVVAKRASKVVKVDSERIVLKSNKLTDDPLDTGVDIYKLSKYQRSNQDTCINQRPIVSTGEKIAEGEVIADGPSTDMAELALGQNVLVAFMPWNGYNFEDSILINENLVKNDIFSSVHIDSYECLARDTKLGKEEVTQDIPNIGDETLKNLDEAGIVRIGTEVNPGDILVGKVTPKSETQLSPEEKLLRAIFGEKAGEVRDTSLRCPPGNGGVVIATQVFSRKGVDKDERALAIEKQEIARLEMDYRDEVNVIREVATNEIVSLLVGKSTSGRLVDDQRKQLIAKGTELTEELIAEIPFEYLRDIQIGDDQTQEKINEIVVRAGQLINSKRAVLQEKVQRAKEGDELAPGVVKMVKVFVAQKRKIQVGDKLAGRHGNKGVLSQIVPQEDMPFMPDGTPVDIVLNPLGVPSRMNVGQILETHLGLAAWGLGHKIEEILDPIIDPKNGTDRLGATAENKKKLSEELRLLFKVGYGEAIYTEKIEKLSDKEVITLACKLTTGFHMATPVFDAAKEDDIHELFDHLDYHRDGKIALRDGRTGENFEERVTVGVMYMLKLDHLVEDKMHARSIGPYSLVTQQPLGGKAQFGGQRLGEMEVWALEAYGAAYALQEFLTVKSDDVAGRTRMYESIVKGEHTLEPGLPESFNVMMKELQALNLNINLIAEEEAAAEAGDSEDEGEVAESAETETANSSVLA